MVFSKLMDEKQLEKWQKELDLLQKAHPNINFPVMTDKGEKETVYENLETEGRSSIYTFYQ
jgi:hypothetical protein